MRKQLLVIIPAYNEEKNIGNLLDSVLASEVSDIADVLVINDASTDGTEAVARQKGVEVLSHTRNMGYGCSLQSGYRYACKNEYDWVIQLDADGQHDACNLIDIYNRLSVADSDGELPDIVLASRFMEGSGEYPISPARKFAYGLFRTMIKMFSGRTIADPTTGLQGLGRNAFTCYSKDGYFHNKYPDANMVLQMLLLGYKVVEIPALMHNRISGSSMHSGLNPVIYMIKMPFSVIAVWLRIRVFKKK